MTQSAQAIAQTASQLAAQGRDGEAEALYTRGLVEFPGNARFANSAGNFHFKAGRFERAAELFEQALALAPDLVEAGINAAITLCRLERPARAVALLAPLEARARGDASYWRARAESERQARRYCEASASMARALKLDPSGPSTARSRARLSLERSDPDAIVHIESALRLNPGDPHLFYEYAQALMVHGRLDEALRHATALAQHFPAWRDALLLGAEVRWARGEKNNFTDHISLAARATAGGIETYLAWHAALYGVDRHDEAAHVLEQARARWPDEPRLALAQAMAYTEGGNTDQASSILNEFSSLIDLDWCLARARNFIRLGEIDQAERSLDDALRQNRQDVSAWALMDLCWRKKGDPRHEWLHGQDGLVQQIEMPLGPEQFAAIIAMLDDLHLNSAMPLGQSVKLGSQTRGSLLARTEPSIALIEKAIYSVLETYRAALPPHDPDHPLLKHRDMPWLIVGSWSIRLHDQGHHAQHIHPNGLLSSASYYIVPDEVDKLSRPGWLEIGRPPEGLANELGPLRAFRPLPRHCVLFPSTLFHGTRPISSGTRMTVAFDVGASTFG